MSDKKNVEIDIKKKKILLVEDDRNTSLLIQRILDINNFQCIHKTNGKEALELLKKIIPDLILMDVMMPIMDGIKATQIIKQDEVLKNIPIIFLTAQDDERLIKESFNLGVVDYISKPFKNLELIARIKSAIKIKEEKIELIKNSESLQNLTQSIIEKKDVLEKQNEKLKEIDNIKDTFITCITHDFKTPITSIRALTEIMIEDQSIGIPKRKEYLKTILQQVDNLSDMVISLLDSFKIITQSIELRKTNVNLELFCREVFNGFKPIADAKKIDFIYKFDSKIDYIYCDPIKIKEIFQNLLSNAFKFTEKGCISFEVFEDEQNLYFNIIDSGIGISKNDIEKIFEKFYRVKETANLKEGSGLGLFIAKKIAIAHNGDITVKSFPGKGSEFIFFIPKNQKKLKESYSKFELI